MCAARFNFLTPIAVGQRVVLKGNVDTGGMYVDNSLSQLLIHTVISRCFI
jgi:hypothetical protein